jgi:hypothetical protein
MSTERMDFPPDQTGTGEPRDQKDPDPSSRGAIEDQVSDAAIVGAQTSTHPGTVAGDPGVNRSGSGGSGGSDEAPPEEEGSSGQTMEETLGGGEGATAR